MALDVYIAQLANRPAVASSSDTPAGGSWGANTYSFLVVPWYSSSEVYLDYAAPFDWVWDADSGTYSGSLVGAFNGVVVAANDKVSLTVTKPERDYDHLTVYYQTAASFNISNNCIRLTINTTTDNLDGTVTLVINASTANTAALSLDILGKSTDGDYYYVWGDVRNNFPLNQPFTIAGATSDNGAHTSLGGAELGSSGLTTIIYSNQTLSDNVGDGTISITGGAGYGLVNFADYGDLITINPVIDSNLTQRQLHSPAWNGAKVKKSYALETTHERLDITCTGISITLQLLNLLHKYISEGLEFLIRDVVQDNNSYIAGWYAKGIASSTHYLGGKNSQPNYVLSFDLMEEIRRDGL